MSVVTWGLPQYIEPAEIEGHLDDAYQFAYAVASPEYGDYHGHQQTRDENGYTSGSYYLLGADGQWSQTIFADKGLGYQALYNQRPAGAPPPQVSEVTYQVFVHPGATAISAQGGAEGPPAPPAPFGGIQQKSLVQQLQNNQITQGQNRQPTRRFNRNTEVQESANLQQLQSQQPNPRFNRDIQVANSANLAVRPQVVAQEQRPQSNLRELSDMETSASDNVERVVIPVRAIAPREPKRMVPVRTISRAPRMGRSRAMFGPATSLFNEDAYTLLRMFAPPPVQAIPTH